MTKLFDGVRRGDVALAVVLTALGVLLMVGNAQGDGSDTRIDSHSWWSVPVFALATLPVLWRRRDVVVATAVSLAALGVHVLAFGWLVRCGAGLPLAFALAYGVGRLSSGRRSALGGEDAPGPDLEQVDQIVTAASRAGLRVSYVHDSARDAVEVGVSSVAVRVVQEALTNALRHAPGAAVRIRMGSSPAGGGLSVRVENDPASEPPRVGLTGTRSGLQGLSQRVRQTGGSFAAGPTPDGGWQVLAEVGASSTR